MSVVAFKGQRYSVLKKQALSAGRQFEDPEFGRNEKSLFFSSGRAAGIEWKRPGVSSCHCIKLYLLFIDYICTVVLIFLPLCIEC